MDQLLPSLDGLTEKQKLAIGELWKNQQGKFFNGTSILSCITDFNRANTLKAEDPEKAEANISALFALCGYTP